MNDYNATATNEAGSNVLLVLSTCPDRDTAQRLGSALVESRLAACVNIIPGVTSVYRWNGRIERDDECLLLVKTTDANYQRLESWLTDEHPYELPELIAVRTTRGLHDYLTWVHNEVS